MGKTKNSVKKTKEVQKSRHTSTTYDDNFYFRLVEYIQTRGKLPSKKLTGMTKQKLNYHISKLKKLNVVKKKAYGVWEVDSAKIDTVADLDKSGKKRSTKISNSTHPIAKSVYKGVTSKNKKDELMIRGHGFTFTCKLPRKIKNWNNRRVYLVKKKIEYDPIGSYGEMIEVMGHKVVVYEKSIVIYMAKGTSFYNDTAKLAMLDGLNYAKKILTRIEGMFQINIKKQGGYLVKLPKSHYANIRNELAKDSNDKKLKLKCLDDYGREWLLIDDSFNLDELETVHSKTSQKDMDRGVMPWFNGLKKQYESTGQSFTPQMILDMIGMNASMMNQIITREAIKTGIEPTKDLEKAKNKSPPSYVG